ncbi:MULTISPECIES: XrtA/PEP-CTERM system histidine kinase PrsK [Acidiphilium]|uniref:histidine kinase n=1 Tax=Acidiphilium rubrum TaxID=526 RepID=A0A8G2CMF7_ACIRU|nr:MULTISPECIES: XrtA/PEP-CTERM system histidine kinase PrsK [Acidiphilium]SIR22594.1 putative PEP-CTERM system histidine kinase [Acidiphilium rubrum]
MTIIAIVYVCVAITYAILGAGLFAWRRTKGVTIAAGLTALWAISFLIAPVLQDAAWFLQAAGWIGALGALERRFTAAPDSRMRAAIRIMIGFGVASAAVAAFGGLTASFQIDGLVIEARLFFALVTLILIENIFRNADEDIRWHINLPLIAIATMALFTFLLYGDAIIHKRLSASLIQAQAIVYIIVLPLFIGTERRMRRWRNKVQMSHGAAFYTSSLILGGSFLVGLGITGSLLRRYGNDWGSVLEIALVFTGIVLVSVLASSGSARSKLRHTIVTNFFAQRYDYRREWLRCIETLAAVEQGGLPQRVIKALADTIDSPSGVLLLRDAASEALTLTNAGEWNMRSPYTPIDQAHPLAAALARDGFCRLDTAAPPITIDTEPACWLAVSLPDPRSSVPLGMVLLGAPRVAAPLGDESLALLRVIAREISLMLAERRAAEALAEARRFAAAGQRFAFVAHDIKNVANQLALLVSNADHHMDDPEFRDDMMATLRGSVGKIQSMLTRLKSPEIQPPMRLDAAGRLRGLGTAAWSKGAVGVVLDIDDRSGDIAMEPAAFDAVMNHLIDNAIEASAAGEIVSVQVEHAATTLAITITDRGVGMSDSFIRDQLFRPFTSSKANGFGLGAFQARELVHAAGGTFTVSSTVGIGTVIRLTFPILDPAAHNVKLLLA